MRNGMNAKVIWRSEMPASKTTQTILSILFDPILSIKVAVYFVNIYLLDISNLSVSNFRSTSQLIFFIPLINKATRLQSATCLDHIWMSSTIHVNSGVIHYDQTDHCPTFMNFTPPNSVKGNKCISYSFRHYSDSNN